MRSRKTFKNIVTSLLLQVVIIIYSFIIPQLIIRTFGSNVNGLVSSITQFLAYITLLESGMGPVVKATLYKPIAQKNKSQIENILKSTEKFFRIIALIFVVYLTILSIIYPVIVRNEFHFFYTMSLVVIISISTFAEYYFGMTYTLYLQAEQKTYITSAIQIVSYILNTILIVVLVKCNSSIQIVKLVSGLIFVLKPLVQNAYVKRKHNINLKKADANYKLDQKWDGLAQHIAYVIHSNTDVTILTILTSVVEVSVYSVYYLVVAGIRKIISSFSGGVDASFGNMIAKNEYEALNKNFKTYELFYYTILTIGFVCTLVLILPFVRIYTKGITDADYIRPAFAYLMVTAEFFFSLRAPYSSLTLAAGHFKETRKGAWVEVITNIVISLVLVWKFGIIGVAIGTLVAMIIRTIEFMYHTSKYILERSQMYNIKRVIIVAVEILITVPIGFFISRFIQVNSYFSWALLASITGIVVLSIVGLINAIVYKKDFENLFEMAKRVLKKKVVA